MRKSTKRATVEAVKKGKTFSEYFGLRVPKKQLGFLDVYVDADMEKFFDPGRLLQHEDKFHVDLSNQIVVFFNRVLQAIRAERKDEAMNMLCNLCEPKETHLGYARDGFRGKAIGDWKGQEIYEKLSESRAVKTGILTDLEETALVVSGIDCDAISDMSIMILKKSLILFTQQQCRKYGIPMQDVRCTHVWNPYTNKFELCNEQLPICDGNPIILIPKTAVGRRPVLNSRDFYQHEVLDGIQDQLMIENGLVKVLKNGKRRCSVTKKELAASTAYGFSKKLIEARVERNPRMMKNYRERKKYGKDEE